MTRVDFYILPDADIRQRHLFACKLVEKAFRLGHSIYVHSDDGAQANAVDQLLWSFRSSSFIPHRVCHDPASPTKTSEPVQIGYSMTDAQHPPHVLKDLLINLSQGVPDCFSRFERVMEIVIQEPQVQEITRANYRFYRDRGYRLQTHDLRNPSATP